jgi:hypothetical protein
MALIDVPYDEANPVCQKLADHLENPDGSMKIEGVNFYYMPLEEAMKYAEQDEKECWGSAYACPIEIINSLTEKNSNHVQ